jgi:hypothetical protein
MIRESYELYVIIYDRVVFSIMMSYNLHQREMFAMQCEQKKLKLPAEIIVTEPSDDMPSQIIMYPVEYFANCAHLPTQTSAWHNVHAKDIPTYASIVRSYVAECICIFCEHKFNWQKTTQREFQNGYIRGDKCEGCKQTGGIMRVKDIGFNNLNNLYGIRRNLFELLDTRKKRTPLS